jgi:hypothetical protein
VLPYRVFSKDQRVSHTAIVENKRLGHTLAIFGVGPTCWWRGRLRGARTHPFALRCSGGAFSLTRRGSTRRDR